MHLTYPSPGSLCARNRRRHWGTIVISHSTSIDRENPANTEALRRQIACRAFRGTMSEGRYDVTRRTWDRKRFEHSERRELQIQGVKYRGVGNGGCGVSSDSNEACGGTGDFITTTVPPPLATPGRRTMAGAGCGIGRALEPILRSQCSQFKR